MNSKEIIKQLKTYSNPKNVTDMARFGIGGKNVLGGPNIPTLRKIAKYIKKQSKDDNQDIHSLAQELWDSEIHEARILASFIDDPTKVSKKQMETWVKAFDSWDFCDQVCMNLFDKTPLVFQKIDSKSSRWIATDALKELTTRFK